MAEKEAQFGFGEVVDTSEVGGWLVGAFRPGGTIKPGVDLKGTTELTKGLKIIDVDTHFSEPSDLWSARLPQSMKSRAPYIKRVGDVDYWHIGDQAISPGGASVINRNRDKVLGRLSIPHADDIHPAAYHVKDRLKFMDDMGIWAQICYPNSFAGSSVSLLNFCAKEFSETLIKIYNDDRGDRQRESNNRLLPMALLPVWDSKAMGAEAQRCVEELGAKGFNLPDRPEQFGLPCFTDKH